MYLRNLFVFRIDKPAQREKGPEPYLRRPSAVFHIARSAVNIAQHSRVFEFSKLKNAMLPTGILLLSDAGKREEVWRWIFRFGSELFDNFEDRRLWAMSDLSNISLIGNLVFFF